MQVAFDNAQLYSQVFSRNNKKQAHKNIRCFPLCSERGHVEQGFCGQPIVIRVSRPAADRQELFAWGELKRCDLGISQIEDDREPPSVLPIDVGTVVTLAQLQENSKDPKTAKTETLDKPLFEGFLEKHQTRTQQELKFAFNEQKKGWSYNWQATKHTAKARHAFFVYLFVQSQGEFTCVGVHMSPSFILYCRKTRAVGARKIKPAAAAAAAAEEPCRKRSKPAEEGTPQWFDPPSPPPLPLIPEELHLDDIDFDLLDLPPVSLVMDNEEDDNMLLDLETATRVDAASIKRIELVLQAIYAQLTKEGTADLFDLNQFSLDWFVKDLGTVKEEVMWNNGSGTPRTHPTTASQDASPLVVQLANYLLEESTLTASVRQIVESSLDRFARREALLRMFHHELATFLVTFGYTERDLDQALLDQQHIGSTSPMSDSTVHFAALEEQLAQMARTQQRASPATCKAAAATVNPQADLSGHWRLDDSVLSAFDECRAKRGVPYMLRKLISYTESKMVMHHTPDCITMEHKSKLFSIGQEVIVLDSKERALQSALPVPWSNQTLRGETYFAAMENDMVTCTRTYGGIVRTVVTARKDESDRLEVDIQYLEKRPGIDANWKCIFAKRGYGLRIASID